MRRRAAQGLWLRHGMARELLAAGCEWRAASVGGQRYTAGVHALTRRECAVGLQSPAAPLSPQPLSSAGNRRFSDPFFPPSPHLTPSAPAAHARRTSWTRPSAPSQGAPRALHTRALSHGPNCVVLCFLAKGISRCTRVLEILVAQLGSDPRFCAQRGLGVFPSCAVHALLLCCRDSCCNQIMKLFY